MIGKGPFPTDLTVTENESGMCFGIDNYDAVWNKWGSIIISFSTSVQVNIIRERQVFQNFDNSEAKGISKTLGA